MSDRVLVIGGGIAGIQAALDLAEAGTKVVLVERGPTLGGVMAALDKNFPTLDCSICIEAPKLREVMEHGNIEVLTLAQVTQVEGQAGNFKVTIHQEPRFVTDECTRCDDCVPACPQVTVNEFDAGIGARKAIYTPFAQAEPGAYAIDLGVCLNRPPNYLPCDRCLEACLPRCIDFSMLPRTLTREVGSILVCTGFDLLETRRLPEYGYGTHPDILTALEFERLLNAAGPSDGHLVRPSDGRTPESILFVLCVGSRDVRNAPYCSRICCMYSTKEAFQALDHGIKDVTLLYLDLRAYGKGFDAFFERTRAEGAKYVRGRPATIAPRGDRIHVRFENTDAGRVEERDFDLVVLAPALVASRGTQELAQVLGIELDSDGFYRTLWAPGGVVATSRPGIYTAGCATGPKDIADTVAEAAAAAASAATHITTRSWPAPIHAEPLPPLEGLRVGVFVCDCGSNIAGTVDMPRLVEYAAGLDGVAHAERHRFSCAGLTSAQITETIRQKNLNRLVVAACSPTTHAPTFQRAAASAGLNPYLVEMANIRNQDSWVHKEDPRAATIKAMDLVRMAVEKAKLLHPLETVRQPVTPRALVVGGGIAGMSAAANLARQGFETHLVEQEPELGGMLRRLRTLAPDGIEARALIEAQVQVLKGAGVRVHTATQIESISGFVGNFAATLSSGETLEVGAVVLATGAQPYRGTEFGYGNDPRVITNLELEERIDQLDGQRVTLVACVGSRKGNWGCSRYCCQTMIHQALQLRQRGHRVRVLYKDLRTVARHAEEAYLAAAQAGVQFFQYDQALPPEEAIRFEDGIVVLDDELLGSPVAIPTDLVVLQVGLVPPPEADGGISRQLKVSRGEDGFLLERHPKLGPVEAAVEGIYLAGTAQGPKDIATSIAQGLAAASKASRILSHDTIELQPLAAIVDREKCTGCTLCEKVCPFSAIVAPLKVPATVNPALCMGCGACAAECPQDAITMPGFTDEQVLAQIDAATEESPQEKVLVFACNWCSYAGADQAGIAKIQYPPSSRIIKTMCSARVAQKFVLRAFQRGAGAVLVSGCHPGDCHYIDANLETAKRVPRWRKKVEHRGIAPERLQLAWFTAAEGRQFAEKMKEMDALIRGRAQEPAKEPVAELASARSPAGGEA